MRVKIPFKGSLALIAVKGFASGSVSFARTLVVIPSFNVFIVPPFTTLIESGLPVGWSLTLVIFIFMMSSGEHPGSPS